MCKNCENGKVLKAKQNESVLAVIFISFIQTKMAIFKILTYKVFVCTNCKDRDSWLYVETSEENAETLS